MAYLQSGNTIIQNFSGGDTYGFANVTIQNNGSLQIDSAEILQGTVAGYSSGGGIPGNSNTIDKFPFSVDTNATDVGDLTQARRAQPAGQSSTVSGYTSGGYSSPPASVLNTIDKFPFAANANATDVGDLSLARARTTGQSSTVSGYTSGGYLLAPGAAQVNNIDKFPFASDTNASDVGDLTQARRHSAGQASTVSGYTSGGAGASEVNTIDKFPFAVDSNATDVGDLTVIRRDAAGQSSTTHGYSSGGYVPPAIRTNVTDKFPFANDTNASDVGDLTQARQGGAGQSSTSFGYTSGGFIPPNANTIDKFPFAADTNASDVGDLTQARSTPAGQQD